MEEVEEVPSDYICFCIKRKKTIKQKEAESVRLKNTIELFPNVKHPDMASSKIEDNDEKNDKAKLEPEITGIKMFLNANATNIEIANENKSKIVGARNGIYNERR